MGIKGIYDEIGPGKRIALSKLAVEKFEETGRPLRIAIDLSIWQFQTQSGKGGTNPALRNLYFRLLKLLSLAIQPLFIFDGPARPAFKRNRKVFTGGTSVSDSLTRRLLDLFGFPHYVAPGEAEAECAQLQRAGRVDAVLSEDVDVLMFGCGLSFRNWSSEGSRGNKSPTHVSVYSASDIIAGPCTLDKEDMTLIAMMSGGDYTPEGIPGCGIKIAREAAKAGFGKSLCNIPDDDTEALCEWKEKLVRELHTNESRFFKSKHKSLRIPNDFPDRKLLRFYTDPTRSSIKQLRNRQIAWDRPLEVGGLRNFVAETFEWRLLSGAKKLIRGLAPALLVHRLRMRGQSEDTAAESTEKIQEQEVGLVKAILGNGGASRKHFSTDGLEELRVAYVPNALVGLDLDAEEVDSDPDDAHAASGAEGALSSAESDNEITERHPPRSPSKRKLKPSYDPTQPEKAWVLSTWVKIGVPLMHQDWQEPVQDPYKHIAQKEATKRAAAKRKTAKGGVPQGMAGSMDRFVKITKPVSRSDRLAQAGKGPQDFGRDPLPNTAWPLAGAGRKRVDRDEVKEVSQGPKPPDQNLKVPSTPELHDVNVPIDISSDEEPEASRPHNPWTLSKRPPNTYSDLPADSSYPALGIFSPPRSKDPRATKTKNVKAPGEGPGQFIGLVSPPSTPATKKGKQKRAPQKTSALGSLQQTPNDQKQINMSPLGRRAQQETTPTERKEKEHMNQQISSWQSSPVPALDISSTARGAVLSRTYDGSCDEPSDHNVDLTSSPALPSPSSLLSPSHDRATAKPRLPLGGESKEAVLRAGADRTRKGRLIALRSSLEGTWAEVDDLEAQARSRTWRHEEVDHVDLASD